MSKGYNTHLAAEFYVLSVLHRRGLSASLTLGNRKAVDIVVEYRGRLRTIDVKGMASKTNWPMDNFRPPTERGAVHFVALVTFNNRISDPAVTPAVYLVPARKLLRFVDTNPGQSRRYVRYRRMHDRDKRFLGACVIGVRSCLLPRKRQDLTPVAVASHTITVMPDNLPLPWALVNDGAQFDVPVCGTVNVDILAQRIR